MTAQITADIAKKLHNRMNEALAEVASEFGLTFKPGNARYSGGHFSAKVEFNATANAATGEPAHFARNAKVMDLPEDCFGTEFDHAGERYRITDITLRRRKYPVSAINVRTNRGHKFPAATVRLHLTGSKLPPFQKKPQPKAPSQAPDMNARIQNLRAAWSFKSRGTTYTLDRPVGNKCGIFSTAKPVMASLQAAAAKHGLHAVVASNAKGAKSVAFVAHNA